MGFSYVWSFTLLTYPLFLYTLCYTVLRAQILKPAHGSYKVYFFIQRFGNDVQDRL
jgi:hypothetical protein